MNKTSDIAFEVAQDIYILGGDIDKLHEEYDNHHISEQVYYKKLYVLDCEATYLEQVVNVMKSQGYKFARYEKELDILQSVLEDIGQSLNIENVNSLNMLDMKRLVHLTTKYKDYVPMDEDEEEVEF